jgi:hypothetical protein
MVEHGKRGLSTYADHTSVFLEEIRPSGSQPNGRFPTPNRVESMEKAGKITEEKEKAEE